KTEWSFLGELRLELSPKLDILADLIWHLTNLEKLVIDKYQIADESKRLDALDRLERQNKQCLPLSSSLKHLEILQLAAQCKLKAGIRSISYLLIALPSLKIAQVPLALLINRNEFVDQYNSMYPHASSVEIQGVNC
ncbi:hypothetical protein J3B02_002743, partial [Coemansia erecta]